MNSKRYSLLMLAVLLLSLLAAPSRVSAQTAGPNDPAELETFVDGFMAADMKANHIPGAVVVVVKDGEVFFSKGYGFADEARHHPVMPETTLFRPGSVSKLFTWTAVMQLVEQGKIDLDADINTYLDFEIPATFSQPITMRHLMTHTPGFEDKGQDLFKLKAEDVVSLETYVKSNIPARIFAPGTVGAYSNYGTALAGYMVQRVSGMPFEEYIEKNIFAPLGMEHATFRQPLPDALAKDMASGYAYSAGQYLQGGFEYVVGYPAGSLSASGLDMAKFMIAHLQNGRYGDAQILSEATAEKMHTFTFSHDPRLDGMALGFFASTLNGQRVISHGGDTVLFHSGLMLLPEQNLGIFVSTNGVNGGELVSALQIAFMNRYFPAEEMLKPIPSGDFSARKDVYVGEYYLSRNNFTTLEKLLSLFSTYQVRVDETDTVLLTSGGETQRFVETAPGLLQGVEQAESRLVMREAAGQVYLFPSSPFVLMKAPWYATTSTNLLVLVVGVVLFLAVLIGWGISFVNGLRKKEPRPALARLARWIAGLFMLVILIFLLGFFGTLADMDPVYGVPNLLFEVPAGFDLLMMLPVASLVFFVGMAFFAALSWIKRWWSVGGRLVYTLATIWGGLMLALMVYWNLLF